MDRSLVTIYRAATLQDAYLLRNRLEEEGIKAQVGEGAIEQGAGVDIVGFPTNCRVAVFEEDAERALQLVMEFEQAVCGGCCKNGSAEPLPGDDSPAQVDSAAVWPVCPKCGAARTAICPFCEATADSFPLADDFNGSPDAEQALRLLCPTCDEPHEARFLSKCGHCGYQFSPDEVVAPAEESTPVPVALYVGVAVVIAVPLALVIYLMVVLR
jgi:hypothetical protein